MGRKVLHSLVLVVLANLAIPAFSQSFASVQKFPVGPSPIRIVTADFNNDQIPDLATLDSSGNSISILLGKGDGTFAPAQHFDINIGGTDLAAADISHVGNIDLRIYHSGYPDGATITNEDVAYVDEGRGDGTLKLPLKACFCMATTAKPGPMVLGDLAGRGELDFVQAMYTPGPNNQITGGIRIAMGDEEGGFYQQYTVDSLASSQNGTGTTITDPVIGDFNDDGHTDIAYVAVGLGAQPTAQLSILVNQANAVISAPSFAPQVFDTIQLPVNRVTAADLNGDGKLDMILTYSGCLDTCQGFTVYMNQGGGHFQRGPNVSIDSSMYANPRATVVADFNGDKRSDVAFLTRKNAGNAVQATDVVVMFTQNADGSFAPSTEVALSQPGENIAATNLVVADWNGDGLPDLAVASSVESDAAVALSIPPPPPAPDFALALSTSTVTVNSRSSANLNVNLTALNGFNAGVTLSCSGLPAHAACAFAPPQLTPGSTPTTAALTILTNVATTASFRHMAPQFLFATVIPAFGFVFLGVPVRRRRRTVGLSLLLLALALALVMAVAGCGGAGGSATTPPATSTAAPAPPSNPAPTATAVGSYTITVTATSGSMVHTAAVSLKVQ
jgi:hypothetical protein